MPAPEQEVVGARVRTIAGHEWDIVDVRTSSDEVDFDVSDFTPSITSTLSAGDKIEIEQSTGNDGRYEISSVSVSSGTATIALKSSISDSTADGIVAYRLPAPGETNADLSLSSALVDALDKEDELWGDSIEGRKEWDLSLETLHTDTAGKHDVGANDVVKMELTPGKVWSITGVSTGSNGTFSFDVSSYDQDVTVVIQAGDTVVVNNSTGNDGEYTVKSISVSSGTATITVEGSVPDSTADGDIQVKAIKAEGLDDLSCSFTNELDNGGGLEDDLWQYPFIVGKSMEISSSGVYFDPESNAGTYYDQLLRHQENGYRLSFTFTFGNLTFSGYLKVGDWTLSTPAENERATFDFSFQESGSIALSGSVKTGLDLLISAFFNNDLTSHLLEYREGGSVQSGATRFDGEAIPEELTFEATTGDPLTHDYTFAGHGKLRRSTSA